MKWYWYIGGAVILAAILKKDEIKAEINEAMGNNTDEVKNALKTIGETYGVDKAQMTERLIRWETAHFKSTQWKKGNTAGMEIAKGKFVYPYGWSSLKEFSEAAAIKPEAFSTYDMIENGTGLTKTFIKFPSAYLYVLFLVYVIKKRNWNWGAWYSTNADKQATYFNKIMGVKPRFTNEIFNQ
jgi:hypothetical protein